MGSVFYSLPYTMLSRRENLYLLAHCSEPLRGGCGWLRLFGIKPPTLPLRAQNCRLALLLRLALAGVTHDLFEEGDYLAALGVDTGEFAVRLDEAAIYEQLYPVERLACLRQRDAVLRDVVPASVGVTTLGEVRPYGGAATQELR